MRPASALRLLSRVKTRQGSGPSGWFSRLLPPIIALGAAAAFSTASCIAAGERYPREPLELSAQVVPYPSRGRAIFVGDVHGCALELTQLLAAVEFDEDDLLVLVGDLIGKGANSTGVIKLARALGPQCIAVRGNHDQAILDWYACILRPDLDSPGSPGSQSPLTPEELASPPPASAFEVMPESMSTHRECAESLSPSDWAWLGSLPTLALFPELNTIAVHAGIVPGAPLSHTPPRDALNIRFVSPSKGLAASKGGHESSKGGEKEHPSHPSHHHHTHHHTTSSKGANSSKGSGSSKGSDSSKGEGSPTGGAAETEPLYHRSGRSDAGHALWGRIYSGLDGPTSVNSGPGSSGNSGSGDKKDSTFPVAPPSVGEGARVLRALLRALDHADAADAAAADTSAAATSGSAATGAATGAAGAGEGASYAAVDTIPILPLPLLPAPVSGPAPASGSGTGAGAAAAAGDGEALGDDSSLLLGSPTGLRNVLSSSCVAAAASAAAAVAAAAEEEGGEGGEADWGAGKGLSKGQAGVRVDVAAIEAALATSAASTAAHPTGSTAGYVSALGGAARPHVIFGHDARQGLQLLPYATGLDSGAVYGRRLSALVFPPRACWAGVARQGRQVRRESWQELLAALERGEEIAIAGVGAAAVEGQAQGGLGPITRVVPAGAYAASSGGGGLRNKASNTAPPLAATDELSTMARSDEVPAVAGQVFHAEEAMGAASHHWLRPQIVQVQAKKEYASIKPKPGV